MSQRRIALVPIGVLAVMVSAVSLAWACFPGTSMTLSRDSGSPGTTVTATLSGFPADQPVEVRLDSFTGPVLAQSARRSSGNPFPLTLTIPANTSAGCHLVVGFVVDEEHRGHSQTAAPFKVVTEANPDPNCTTPPPVPGDPVPGDPPPAGSPPPTTPTPGAPAASGGAIRTPVSAIVPQSGGKTINGTSRSERLRGTEFADVINCGAGNDRVSGGGGNDVINCGGGRDSVNGGAGNDRISGGSGNDKLSGGAGNDRVSGGSGKDKLSGGSGSDRLLGGTGNDTLRGNAGKDRLFGNGGADVLYRGGTDRLFGGSGRNRIIG